MIVSVPVLKMPPPVLDPLTNGGLDVPMAALPLRVLLAIVSVPELKMPPLPTRDAPDGGEDRPGRTP